MLCYNSFDMNILRTLAQAYMKKTGQESSSLDRKQEALSKMGREQFKRLLEKGLTVPVVLL